jgi:uncharacterized Tic20 family protein
MTQHPDDERPTSGAASPGPGPGSPTDETTPIAGPRPATYGEPPVYGTPAGEPAPAPPPPPPGYGAPAYGSAPYGPAPDYAAAPGYSQPGSGQPGYSQPGYSQPGYGRPGYSQTGYGQATGGVPPTPPPSGGAAAGPGRPPGGGPIGADINEERQWAMFAHLGGVLAIFPLVHLLPALIILTVYRKRSALVRDNAREAVNFQIVVLIALVAVWIINHLPLLPNLVVLVWIFSLVFSVLGAVAASKGERYRYPLTRRFLA